MLTGRYANSALILATMDTKAEEARFLADRLRDRGVQPVIADISLESRGGTLGGGKKKAIKAAAARVFDTASQAINDGVNAAVGIGGGTGAEIVLRVFREMPITFPKVLVTPLPFDPRYALADNFVTLVPSLADINGLNATLREILENAAAMTSGLCRARRRTGGSHPTPSIGITALGATDGAVVPLVKELRKRGEEATVFHANGFGGAAFSRFAEHGAFRAIVDLTPHEMTRFHLAGVHARMRTRFTTGGAIPRVVLPGALNFIGLGEKHLIHPDYLERPHYEHSGLFTHVKLTNEEMSRMAGFLAKALNECEGPRTLIVPMGGFSHQDRHGGDIEDPDLRIVFLETVRKHLRHQIKVKVLDAHLFDQAVTAEILSALCAAATIHGSALK